MDLFIAAATAAQNVETNMAGQENGVFSNTAATAMIVLTIATLCLLLKILSSRSRSKELSKKVLDLQNELLKTQKNLEDLTKEHNRKFDPYSSPNTKSIILFLDKDGCILSGNDYAFEFFGYTDKTELLGKNIIGTVVPPKDSHGQNMTNLIERIKNNPRLYVDNENENICKNGKKVWVSWTNRIVYDSDGVPSEIRAVGFDISARKRLEDELRQMTVLDPITGVLNRQRFLDDGTRELKRARRYGRDLSVLLLTIDRFETRTRDGIQRRSGESRGDRVSGCHSRIGLSGAVGGRRIRPVVARNPRRRGFNRRGAHPDAGYAFGFKGRRRQHFRHHQHWRGNAPTLRRNDRFGFVARL